MVRQLLLGAVIAISVVPMGCGGDNGCECGATAALVVQVSGSVPPGGEVQVCFANSCAIAAIDGIGAGPEHGSVDFEHLGSWVDDKRRAVTVRVRDKEGEIVRERAVAPERTEGDCCADTWTARM